MRRTVGILVLLLGSGLVACDDDDGREITADERRFVEAANSVVGPAIAGICAAFETCPDANTFIEGAVEAQSCEGYFGWVYGTPEILAAHNELTTDCIDALIAYGPERARWIQSQTANYCQNLRAEEYNCGDGSTIARDSARCDGVDDCPNGADEAYCAIPADIEAACDWIAQ